MENNLEKMLSNKKIARVAGLWYLLLAITSGFSWMYITKIFVSGNAPLTAHYIIASETQYLIAIISNIIGQISFIFLGLTLYRLLKQVNETQSKLMLAFVLISIPIMFITIFFQTGALIIITNADYLKVFSVEQVSAFVMMFLNISIKGVHIVEIFWGLWLFPLSYLIYKSNFIPKILAILLIISGISYIISSITSLIFPEIFMIIEKKLSIPEAFGELAILFWLLIKGITISKK